MKKITLFVCLLCIAFVNAQDDDKNTADKLTFDKGTQFVNLNFSLNSSQSDFTQQMQGQIGNGESDAFGFQINASYAYAISSDLFLGIGLGYSITNLKSEINNVTQNESDNKSYQIFPYVRYYKGIGKKLALFVQGEARYFRIENDLNSLNNGTSDNFFVGVRPGITLMLNKNLAIETSIGALGYSHRKGESEQLDTETTGNSFGLSLNSSELFFGLNYYF
ncbi:outer membrane protein beta-barrel domain protein [Kordia sp. SMS9]|uniref:autotransporter outer membrane beta-barrel domain-containing protein n=1 Tax=Kordia sp. SMS9 TaxID=2282170 RepID=UPI000E0DE023|nr:autotransporter outer membrane beta-barrel domain-containing protein [Kordia sp. SMS9]AXG69181.1 outer membrane protein beta-barrel domain protein [Kordia sp. SMS9]